jgi:hypothetical protein
MLDPTDLDLSEETLLAWKTALETRAPDAETNELLLRIQRALYDLHQGVPVKLSSDEITQVEAATGISAPREGTVPAAPATQGEPAPPVSLSDAIQQLRGH